MAESTEGDLRMTDTRVEPVDAVRERLNDPAVAASMVTLLDNSELLSTLVLGLAGFMERGDMIMDAVAEGVNDIKTASAAKSGEADLPSIDELTTLAGQLGHATPLLGQLLDSPIARPETIGVLAALSEAASEGIDNAARNNTEVSGPIGAVKALRDPEVAKGLGVFLEIAKALGKRV